MEHWRDIISHMPFLAGMTSPSINSTRIIEALLIAGGTAMLTSVMTADKVSARLEERVSALVNRIDKCEQDIARVGMDGVGLRERLAVCEARIESK